MFPKRLDFMPDHEQIRHWLLNTVQLVVDNPDDVAIEIVLGDQRTIFRIRVNSGDVGKVIGKQGRTSQSLRTLTGAIGMKARCRFILEIDEGKV
jgi:uncharacterized protein